MLFKLVEAIWQDTSFEIFFKKPKLGDIKTVILCFCFLYYLCNACRFPYEDFLRSGYWGGGTERNFKTDAYCEFSSPIVG